MVITLIEYAIYFQAITTHNGHALAPQGGKLNTFLILPQQNFVPDLFDSQIWRFIAWLLVFKVEKSIFFKEKLTFDETQN